MAHAYSASTGGLLFTENQWAAFNKEGFIDALVHKSCGYGKRQGPDDEMYWAWTFPERFVSRQSGKCKSKRRGIDDDLHLCAYCDRTIISRVRTCGECRLKHKLPRDDPGLLQPVFIMCEHSRENAPGDGQLLRNCERLIDKSRVRQALGMTEICPKCVMYLMSFTKKQLREFGYEV